MAIASHGDAPCSSYGCQETVRGPWDASVTHAALRRGDVDLLRYLLQRGCPVNAEVRNVAATMQRPDIVECLEEFGGN